MIQLFKNIFGDKFIYNTQINNAETARRIQYLYDHPDDEDCKKRLGDQVFMQFILNHLY